MAQPSIEPIVRHIRRLVRPALTTVPTDRQLIETFASRQDESAFAALTQRHGPMVLGVCRRILRHAQDAEDAFQATFLVLARKAAAVCWQESVGGWLYEVASRIALKAKTERQRWTTDERQVDMAPTPDSLSLVADRELQTVLDEEMRRLPEKYRLPVVLCYLEGLTRSSAARQLGWQEGTVAGRLARARVLLQRRLVRRGIVLSAAALPAVLAEQFSPAAVPGKLAADTATAATHWIPGTYSGTMGLVTARALALSQGALHTMSVGRRMIVTALLLTVGLLTATSAAVLTVAAEDRYSAGAEEPARAGNPLPPSAGRGAPPADEQAEPKVDPRRVEAAVASGLKWLVRHQAPDGHWSLDEFHKDGRCNCTGRAQVKDDTAGTGLALLALLSAGQTHRATGKEHPYAKNVERALKWLITHQGADGAFSDVVTSNGLAALALVHAYSLTTDPILKGPAQRATNHMVTCAGKGGPGQLSAAFVLLVARHGGLNVPNAALVPAPAVENPFGQFCAAVAVEFVGAEHGPSYSGPRLVNRLLDAQVRGFVVGSEDQKGSWYRPGQPPGSLADRLTTTALTLLTLEAGQTAWTVRPRGAAAVKEAPIAEVAAAWEALRGTNYVESRVAVLALLAAPKQAVSLLATRLQPAPPRPPGEAERIARLVANLDAAEFEARQRATDELARLGEEPEAALRKALEGKPPLEVRQRVEQLLEKVVESQRLGSRELRAVEVLARIGAPEARRVLSKLAGGNPQARLTQAAKAAIDHLDRSAREPVTQPLAAPGDAAALPSAVPAPPKDERRVHVYFSQQQHFGIVCTRLRDPADPARPKRLTYDERGLTNNTCLRIDGRQVVFGSEDGGCHFVREDGKLLKQVPIPVRTGKSLVPALNGDCAWRSAWEANDGKIRITQSVAIVNGEQTLLPDTVLVKYRIENRDDQAHRVGLRFLLNACIGRNAGPPFYVPASGEKPARLVDTVEVLPAAIMPDFIQAMETGDMNDANATYATVGLKLKGFEPVEKVAICRWPDNSAAGWGGTNDAGDWKYEPINRNAHYKDSCVVLYWATVEMKAGAQRDLAFTYGLGRITRAPAEK